MGRADLPEAVPARKKEAALAIDPSLMFLLLRSDGSRSQTVQAECLKYLSVDIETRMQICRCLGRHPEKLSRT